MIEVVSVQIENIALRAYQSLGDTARLQTLIELPFKTVFAELALALELDFNLLYFVQFFIHSP